MAPMPHLFDDLETETHRRGSSHSRTADGSSESAAPTTPRGRSATRRSMYDDQYHTVYRSRSLSTGRSSRPRSGHDLIQDVYDKMGVNYKRGEASPLPAAAATASSAAPPAAGPAATAAAAASSAANDPAAVPDGDVAAPRTPRGDGESASSLSSSSIAHPGVGGATKIYTASGSTVSSPLRDKFQRLYFRSSSAGTAVPLLASTRGREMERLGLHDPASSERRRSRSLTRATGTTSATTSTATATTGHPHRQPQAAVQPRWHPAGELVSSSSQHLQPAQARPAGQVVAPLASAGQTRASSAPAEANKKSPAGTETEAASTAGVGALGGGSATAESIADASSSREDSTNVEAVILPSVKERLALFGGNGKTPPSNKKGGNRRLLAATRDYPPKIDIYGTKRPQMQAVVPQDFDGEDEKKDDGDYPAPSSSTLFEQSQPINSAPKVLEYSSKESSGGCSRVSSGNNSNIHHGYLPNTAFRSVPTVSATPEPSRFQMPNASRQLATQPSSVLPSSSQRPAIGLKVAPVIEFPVVTDTDGAAGLVGGAHDNCSVVSSLGADETAVGHSKPSPTKKLPSWTAATSAAVGHRGSLACGVATTPTVPISAVVMGGGPPTAAGAARTASPIPPVRQSTLTNDWIERVVEERLQAHLTVLEVRTEAELRRRTREMEERLSAKLQSLEDKVVALTTAANAATVPACVAADGAYEAAEVKGIATGSVRSAPPHRAATGAFTNLGRYSGW